MTGEYPCLPYAFDWETAGYDGDVEIEPNMTLSVESYVGHRDAGEGASSKSRSSSPTRASSAYRCTGTTNGSWGADPPEPNFQHLLARGRR